MSPGGFPEDVLCELKSEGHMECSKTGKKRAGREQDRPHLLKVTVLPKDTGEEQGRHCLLKVTVLLKSTGEAGRSLTLMESQTKEMGCMLNLKDLFHYSWFPVLIFLNKALYSQGE